MTNAGPHHRPRVLFDISLLGIDPTAKGKSGVVRTAEELARCLQSRPDLDVDFSGFHSWDVMTRLSQRPTQHLELERPFRRGPRQSVPCFLLQTIGRIGWRIPPLRPYCFPIENRRKQALDKQTLPTDLSPYNILHSPFYPFPDHIRQQRSDRQFGVLTTVHDLIPLRVPEYIDHSGPHFKMIRNMMDQFDEFDWVACDSAYTRDDLLNECPRLDPDKVTVIPLAASDKFKPTEFDRQELLRRLFGDTATAETIYFSSLCSIEPRKNLPSIVRAFEKVVEITDADVRLALIGATTSLSSQVMPLLKSTEAQDKVHLVGSVPDDLLPAAYSGSVAFLYLSTFEGFGLPPLEAMKCGVPTITANCTSLPEVVGDAGVLVEPFDIDQIAHEMLRFIDNPEHRRHYVSAGIERAKCFSWTLTVDKVKNIYLDMLQWLDD